MTFRLSLLAAGLLLADAAAATPSFVNGLALSGGLLDLSGGASANDGRVGYFSDLYYDPNRNEWWGLSDRGPGGGTLNYDTRVQRFTLDVNSATGAISNFQIAETIKFTRNGNPLNGLAPSPAGTLGNAFDPEGFVVNPRNGNFIVSDEYGAVYEFNRSGQVVLEYKIPANILPKVGSTLDYNTTPQNGLTAGREPNRGFEGLAISPDGNFAYAVLQNGTIQDGWNSGTRGQYTRIVKFDTSNGDAVGQYAYQLNNSGQGRGISALVALDSDTMMILERNNRGVGVGATLANPDKNVFLIDLGLATDVSGINLPASGSLPSGYLAAAKSLQFLDLDANTLIGLGNKSPEKWEGLTIGPRLADGSYLLLAGTDNDYSVTQNGTGTQFDVWFNFNEDDPYNTSIQCPLGSTVGCTGTLTPSHTLLPGVLHAYKASAADLAGYVAPVPEPSTLALFAPAVGLLGTAFRRKNRT